MELDPETANQWAYAQVSHACLKPGQTPAKLVRQPWKCPPCPPFFPFFWAWKSTCQRGPAYARYQRRFFP